MKTDKQDRPLGGRIGRINNKTAKKYSSAIILPYPVLSCPILLSLNFLSLRGIF